MITNQEQMQDSWWARGDLPVRTHSRVTYLVDGQAVLLMMCIHFLKAQQYVYLANWGMTPTMELVRGTDHRAGPDDDPAQVRLLESLRAAGLQEPEIQFWCEHDLTLQNVLGYLVSKGVEVKALLWESPELFSHYNPQTAYKQLTAVGVTCVLDDSSRGILHHPVESLHQKTTIVDGRYSFVGGVDPLIELSGDFDRWDLHTHPFDTHLRRATHKDQAAPHPWHDAHAMIEGPAASDVETNFRQRWNDVVERRRLDLSLIVPEHPLAPPIDSPTITQVARTFPKHTYNFDSKDGIQSIAELYANSLNNIQRFVYLENQYFWLRAYSGVDLPFLGLDSPDMEYNIVKLGEALQRGASVTLILPDHPNVGRSFSDAGIARLKSEAPDAINHGLLHVFTLATSTLIDGKERYRPVYVHAKVAIIDDLWVTVGSANLNNRGMRDDTEINVATLDMNLAHGLRLMLWGEHLGLLSNDDMLSISRYLGGQPQHPNNQNRAQQLLPQLGSILNDHLNGLKLMRARAEENLQRYKMGQPLVGHLLPYLTADEAQKQNLNFEEEHGWIEESPRTF